MSLKSVSLLHRSSWGYLRRHPWQTGLMGLGIALAVAMVVAVDVANSSARRAFALTLESVTAGASHQILGGPSGIDERIYTSLRTDLGFRSSAPVIRGRVRVQGRTLILLGTDPFSEVALNGVQPDSLALADAKVRINPIRVLLQQPSVVLSQQTAQQLGLKSSESFNLDIDGAIKSVVLAATFEAENPAAAEGLVFADMSTAQWLLGRFGVIDSIDLHLQNDEVEPLREWLPAGLTLIDTGNRQQGLMQMSAAFHHNLTAMSLLALLVAALLIVNTVTFSVLKRRTSLGILRSLGVTRSELIRLICIETLIVAVVFGVLGCAFGVALGQVLVRFVSGTISDLYFHLHVTAFLLDYRSIAKGFVLGLGTAFISSLVPAWEAGKSLPVQVLQRSVVESGWHRRLPWMLLFGAVLAALGSAWLQWPSGSLWGGFAALGLQVVGFCLCIPALLMLLVKLIMAVFGYGFGISTRMAVRGIARGVSRSGLAVAALALALSVTVGVGVMIGSFRQTVIHWLEQSLQGDMHISVRNRNTQSVPADLIDDLRHSAEVFQLRQIRRTLVETQFGPLRLMAVASPTPLVTPELIMASEANWQTRLQEDEGVMISETLAYHRSLSSGDSITLLTDVGEKTFSVLGVFYDYTSSRGLLLMDDQVYRQWWRDQRVTAISLSRPPNVSAELWHQRVAERLVPYSETLQWHSSEGIRALSLALFDRTFTITQALRLLVIVVAMVSIISALLALQLERQQQYALLRAMGMKPGQLMAMVLTETGLMGLVAALLAMPMGVVMADVLIDVINRRSFGWSIQFYWAWETFLQAFALGILSALVAGLYPAWRAARLQPANGLREQ
jgi:putative ABC transport system permease protein